jgi:hypothetical protein
LNQSAASGVDKVTAAYAVELQANIQALVEKLKAKHYRAKLVRRVYIPKENGQLQSACRRIKSWIKQHRHLPDQAFFKGLNRRLRGHYNYYGVRGNSRSLYRFYDWAMACCFKWLNRRGGKRRSFTWEQFSQVLERLKIGDHRIRIRMLVQEQLQRLAGMCLPVEVGGKRLGRHHVEQGAGGARRQACRAKALQQAATVHLSAQECANEVFLLVVHLFSPPLRVKLLD